MSVPRLCLKMFAEIFPDPILLPQKKSLIRENSFDSLDVNYPTAVISHLGHCLCDICCHLVASGVYDQEPALWS